MRDEKEQEGNRRNREEFKVSCDPEKCATILILIIKGGDTLHTLVRLLGPPSPA